MAIPIVLKTGDEEVQLAQGVSTCFVIAKGGVYRRRETELFSSCTPATAIPQALKEQEVYLHLNEGFPQMPVADLQKVAGFFLEVFNVYKSEAIVILVRNKQTGAIEIICPKQYITVWKTGNSYSSGSMSVKYDMPEIDHDKYTYFGDIHSHCDFSAYASGTDTHDEEYRDGVHMVLGKITQTEPDFHCEFAVDGMRFLVRYNLVVDGKYGQTDMNFPKEWMKTITLKESSYQTNYKFKGWTPSTTSSSRSAPTSSRGRVLDPDRDVPEDVLRLFGDDQDDSEVDKRKWRHGK